jgi:uncharacterized Zn finger protein (UPF0148 family)
MANPQNNDLIEGSVQGVNKCPVCDNLTYEAQGIIYCTNCSFNVERNENESEPKPGG